MAGTRASAGTPTAPALSTAGRDAMSTNGRDRGTISGRVVWLVAGAVAIAAGTALGWDSAALASIVNPPVLVRAALGGTAVGVGVLLLVAALARLAAGGDADRDSTNAI